MAKRSDPFTFTRMKVPSSNSAFAGWFTADAWIVLSFSSLPTLAESLLLRGVTIGCWSPGNNELYNRRKVVFWDFGFLYFDTEQFSADDHLIYSAYMREAGGLNPA